MAYKPFGDGSSGIEGNDSNANTDIGASAPFLLDNGDGSGDGSGGSSGDARGDKFDPTIHVGRDKLNADGSYRRKRGRRANSATSGSGRKANNQASIEGLTRMLAIVHIGLASATKTPELRLEDAEAEALAKSTAVVLEEFDIRPDPKIEAIVGLVTTAGMIYGPRVYLIAERKKREKMETQ